MLNSRDVSLLRDDVEANCRKWLERCKAAGLNVLITNTVRDKEYQEYLYAQGRTRPGSIVTNGRTPTFHSDKAGLAFDFCKNVRGHEYDDAAFFRKAAAIAKEMGFSWGGDWKSFPDSPHIQWDEGGKWTSSMILAGKLPAAMPLWGDLDKALVKVLVEGDEEDMAVRYNTMAEIQKDMPWAVPTIQKLIRKGGISGSGKKDAQGMPADMDLSKDMIREFVVNDKMGLYGA